MMKPMTNKPSPNSYRQRFGFTRHPLPRDAAGETFFSQTPGYSQLESHFHDLLDEPGLGLLTAEAGVGKTAAIRNLCSLLPAPDYLVIYLCDTYGSPFDLYRTLAVELGLRPSQRKAQLWTEVKGALAKLLDEQHTTCAIVVDEAQHLSDHFLADLSGFLNFAFDRRSLAALWLVGLPSIARRLRTQIHAPLQTRLVAHVHLAPLERETFHAFIEHGIQAAGSREKLLTDPALEMLFRASRGIPRIASRVLRAALKKANTKNQNLVDDYVLRAAIEELTPATEEATP
jgi:type II secretory pathway predicted ATPase ExeA